ncbi:MAG: GFA family protein [Gammaproteobacteria bacterium]|nr:GFA family protein [Gammaproteobacteria bacterium]
MIIHQGGCHCGRVRFEVRASAVINVSECNCSICSKSGYLGMIVPRDRFTLKSGEDSLTEYTFDSKVAKHLFCKHCGIKSFYIPRSHPEGISINARCLDPGTVEKMKVTEFDGRNWERYYPKGRADGYTN